MKSNCHLPLEQFVCLLFVEVADTRSLRRRRSPVTKGHVCTRSSTDHSLPIHWVEWNAAFEQNKTITS